MKKLVPAYEKHYRLSEVAKHVKKENPLLLDVGCGDKSLRLYLGDNVDYCGIDVDPKCSNKVDVSKDIFPFECNFFDYVVCTEVLEHIDNHQNCLKEIRRILKPSGLLLGTVPNCLSIPRIVSHHSDKQTSSIIGREHLVAFGFSEIKDLLTANNFKVLEQYYFYSKVFDRVPLDIPFVVLRKFSYYIFFGATK